MLKNSERNCSFLPSVIRKSLNSDVSTLTWVAVLMIFRPELPKVPNAGFAATSCQSAPIRREAVPLQRHFSDRMGVSISHGCTSCAFDFRAPDRPGRGHENGL